MLQDSGSCLPVAAATTASGPALLCSMMRRVQASTSATPQRTWRKHGPLSTFASSRALGPVHLGGVVVEFERPRAASAALLRAHEAAPRNLRHEAPLWLSDSTRRPPTSERAPAGSNGLD